MTVCVHVGVTMAARFEESSGGRGGGGEEETQSWDATTWKQCYSVLPGYASKGAMSHSKTLAST